MWTNDLGYNNKKIAEFVSMDYTIANKTKICHQWMETARHQVSIY
jgi:hypothetical protein